MGRAGMRGTRIAIPPGMARWLMLQRGDLVDVVSPGGPQVADAWAFDALDPGEYLSVAHCRLHWSRVRPTVGDELVSNRRNPMLTLLEDTSGGVHDTLLPACDAQRYLRLGCVGYHRNCADNLAHALTQAGLPPCAPQPLNFFENATIDAEGTLEIQPPVCPPGGHVRLRALSRLVLIVSACPQDRAPTNGADRRPKPIDLRRHVLARVPTDRATA